MVASSVQYHESLCVSVRPTYVCTRHHWTGRFIVSRITGAEGTLISATPARKLYNKISRTMPTSRPVSAYSVCDPLAGGSMSPRHSRWWMATQVAQAICERVVVPSCRRRHQIRHSPPAPTHARLPVGHSSNPQPRQVERAFFVHQRPPAGFPLHPRTVFWINSTEAHRAWSVQKRKIDSFKLDLTVP